MNAIGIENKYIRIVHRVSLCVILCLLTAFLPVVAAYGQTKVIQLNGIFTATDFKGAPTVTKTVDGFTIILDNASWDATRKAVKISNGAITINGQQKSATQKAYLFNKIVFDKLGTFNQKQVDSIIPNRGGLTANASNPEQVTWQMDNGDIAVPGYNHSLRMTVKGDLYLDNSAGSMTVSYIESDVKTPYIRLSGSYFEQSILQKTFRKTPTYAIYGDPEMKQNITSDFAVNFYFGKAADLTPDAIQTTDAATGSVVTKLYGRVTIGDTPGDAIVMIRATPYDNIYNIVYGAYMIHIPKMQPQVAFSQDTIKAYLGTEIAMPKVAIGDGAGNNITSNYTVAVEAKATSGSTAPKGTLFSYVDNTKQQIISLKSEGSFAFHYTFTPTNATKFSSYQQDVPVTIIKPTGIIPTTTSFPHEEHAIKLTDTQVKLDTAIVRDDLGNDVTSCFTIKLKKKSDPNNICGNIWTSSWRANDWTMQTNGGAQGTVVFDVEATPDKAWKDNYYYDYSTIFTGSSTTLSYSTATRHARLIVSPNTFTTYINGYIGEDNQPTLRNDYEGVEVGGEYLVRVPLSAEPSATTYENTFNPDSIVTDKNGVEWACYNYTKLKYNKSASNWRLSFGKAVSNTDIIFVFHPWDQTHYGDVSAPIHLTVLDKITPTLKFSQDSCVANVGKPFDEPELTITDANGKNISSHFTLYYTIEQHDGNNATIDASTGRVNIGNDQSYAIITVKATPNTDDAEVYNSGTASYYLRLWKKEEATWNYQIKEGEDAYAYNYDNTSGEVSVTPSDAGMLTFTAAGKMEAGTSIAGVPGLVITFGKEGEKSFTVKGNSDGTFYAVSKEVKFAGSDLVTPAGGTFYKLQPKVNGYVTIRANYLKDNVVTLRWIKDNGDYEDDQYTAKADGVASHTFTYPLFAGQTYYLFNIGNGSSNDGLQLYGINYQPAWLMSRYDTKSYTRAKIYIGSYTGHLPYLMTLANKNVTFSTEYDQENDEQKKQKPKYIVVNPNSRITIAANVDKTAIDNHHLVKNPGIGVLASVKSPETKADGTSKAVKHAIMAVWLSGLPVYIVHEGETPYVGKVVTTTPKTNITMTYGGWSNYYLANPQKGTYGIDSWKTAKMDSVGANDRIFAGFPDYTGGGMNAKHENVYRNTGNYMPSAPSTWDVPCRGAYLKFEPTSNGRLNVYILQNGCCQYSGNPRDIDPNIDGTYTVKVKWTPYYLVDETGKAVDFTEENNTSNAIAIEDEDLNSLGPATKGIYRANYNGEKVGSQTIKWDFSDMGPEAKSGSALAKQREAYIIDNWKSHTKGEREAVFSTAEGAHQIISKAYVRYTFDVQAGKTYFFFSNVSKIGLCGFSYTEDEHQSTQEVPPLPEDGDATPATYKGTFVKVKVPNNYTKGKWSSLCVPFSMNESQFKRTFGRRARLIAFDDLRNDSVLFTRHFYQFVVAGRPYFIYPDTTLTDGFTVDSVYMGKQAKPDDYFLKAPANSYYIAKGLFATAKLNQGSLVVVGSNGKQDGGGKLYTVGSEPANLSAYHAYVDFTGTTSSTGAKAFFTSYDGKEHGSIGGSGTATSIEDITELSTEGNKKATASQGDGRVYSLSGQCVGESPEALTRLPKGVYIVNGEKVIVR